MIILSQLSSSHILTNTISEVNIFDKLLIVCMARYSLFVLKMPLNTNQPTNVCRVCLCVACTFTFFIYCWQPGRLVLRQYHLGPLHIPDVATYRYVGYSWWHMYVFGPREL